MRVVIVGAGGHGQVAADMIAAGARVGDPPCSLPGSSMTLQVVTGSRIGRGAILNTGCTVDHHAQIGDYTHIAPPGVHLGGEVSIGGHTLVGIGAVVLPRCRVGAGCIIGAGAVVIGDVPDGVTMVGVPARPLPSAAARAVMSQPVVDR